MKLSRFHILFKGGDEYFLYNTKTLSLNKISHEIFCVLNASKDKDRSLKNIPEEFIQILQKNKFTDDKDSSDTDYRNKQEYRKRMGSFCDKTLSLIIAPTLSCNFACPYCYEKSLPANIMKENVEDAIVDFIKNFEETCNKINT